MSLVVYNENKRNTKHISEHVRQGVRVLDVDTGKVAYKSKPWRSLSDWNKRKFENLLVLQNPRGMVTKVIYH